MPLFFREASSHPPAMEHQNPDELGSATPLAKEALTPSPLPVSALSQPLVENKESLRSQMLRLEVAHRLLRKEAGVCSAADTRGTLIIEAAIRQAASLTRPSESQCISGLDAPNLNPRKSHKSGSLGCSGAQGKRHQVMGGGIQEVPSSASPSEDGLSPSRLSPREDYSMPRMKSCIFVMKSEDRIRR